MGVAVGNGLISTLNQINSATQLTYFRSFSDLNVYKSYDACCPSATPNAMGYLPPCDFTQYLDIDQQGMAYPKKSDNATVQMCGQIAEKWGFEQVWETQNNAYNTYMDWCALQSLFQYLTV